MSGNSPAPPQGRDKFDAWLDSPKPGPELAAAMAETRQIRHALIVLTAEWTSAAATAEEAREISGDGTCRMMLDVRAQLLREHARSVREAIGAVGSTR